MKDDNKNSQPSINRRRCLQAMAATGGLLASTQTGIVGAASETSFEKRYQSALHVREDKGQEAFFEHLERVGLSYDRKIERYKVRESESNGPGAQSIDSGELDLDSSLVYDCDNSSHIYTDMWWKINNLCAGSDNFASWPEDVVGFTWAETDYKYITGTAYTGDYVCYKESNSECGNYDSDGGIAALYDAYYQSEAEGASCGGSISSYFGGKLYIRSDDEPPYTRRVDAHYKHYYQSMESCSLPDISFGTGIMVSWPDCSPNTWTKEVYETEDQAHYTCDDPIEP